TSSYSVRTFDVGDVDGCHFILMEFVEGESLDGLLKREGRIDEKRAVQITRDVARALEEAHEMGVIHRDIKPANILLTRRGVPKLTDLGIAKNIEADDLGLTATGAVVGTPSYMSPEQAQGLPDVDARSDVYSLGATLYRMVVGELPFKGNTPQNMMYKIATEPVPDPLLRNPQLSQGAAALICKMMAKDRDQRYQTMNEVIGDSEALLTGERGSVQYEQTVSLLRAPQQTHPTEVVVARKGGGRAVTILVVLLMVLVGYFGARAAGFDVLAKLRGTAPSPTSAVDLLEQAGRAFRAGNAEQAKVLASKLIAEFPNAPEVTEAHSLLKEIADAQEVLAPDAKPDELLAQAETARTDGDQDQAKRLAERIVKQFPGTPEATQAQDLLDALAAAQERASALSAAKRAETVGDWGRAAQLLSAALQRWPDDEELKNQLANIQRLGQQQYDEEMATAKTAADAGNWTGALEAYRRAAALRDSEEARKGVAAAAIARASELFYSSEAATEKLVHLKKVTELQGKAEPLAPQINAVRNAVERADAARARAERFRKEMSTGPAATCTLAEKLYGDGGLKMNVLKPQEVTGAQLAEIASRYDQAARQFDDAATAALEELYPDIEKNLTGADYASGFLALYRAKEKHGESERVKALVETHDPRGRCLQVAALLSAAKDKAGDYASAEEATRVRKSINEALGMCKNLGPDRTDAEKARSFKGMALARRAIAYIAEDKSLEALADAGDVIALEGGEEPAQLKPIIGDATAQFLGKFGAELIQDERAAVACVRRVGAVLGGDEYAPVRRRLTAAVAGAEFANRFMGSPRLVGAWFKHVAPVIPTGMVRLPAGTFPLGTKYASIAAMTPPSAPQHPVKLKACYVDTCEVTNEEFQKFVDQQGYSEARYWVAAQGVGRKAFVDSTGKPGPRFWKDGKYAQGAGTLPVVGVSWYEATAYAAWAGKRLPTEVEWEAAAVGVMPKAGGNRFGKVKFPWGERFVSGKANLRDAGGSKLAPAGRFHGDVSPCGAQDMAGNVREWTGSSYDAYPGHPVDSTLDRNY
ncbi:MAG: SUMF1/EgtB/PvdO family nonheme iron enzyme, partial [Bradyrhizobium sp.]|nr:SUMF1/EgtB/PvdO family nonheme iron enzyme [Bradyrhizobium sp.]